MQKVIIVDGTFAWAEYTTHLPYQLCAYAKFWFLYILFVATQATGLPPHPAAIPVAYPLYDPDAPDRSDANRD